MIKRFIYVFAWICFLASPAYAKLSIACAANFTSAMKELVTLYETETGHAADCTFGSTGMLYGQITKGAPYDVFFAADERRPALLHEKGLALPPAPYAKGQVVLWTSNPALQGKKTWKATICCPKAKRIGIANPKTAPYGAKAAEAMASAHVYGKTESKLVFGKNVGMAFQYAYAGAADVSFIALSQALSDKGKKGKHWLIPEASKVTQAACILAKGNMKEADAFLRWMQSTTAKAIITRYGYE